MSRYEPLTRYLEACRAGEAPMTFKEVEGVLNRHLPPSARLHQAWWSNTTTHSHADAWMRPGWRTARVDLGSERLVFVKDGSRGEAPAAPSSTPSQASSGGQFVVHLASLPDAALALLKRYAAERACSFEQATADLLGQAAIDRKRRLLERFPHSGERSYVDSADLIRKERDGRDAR